jgi:hypothetical protein
MPGVKWFVEFNSVPAKNKFITMPGVKWFVEFNSVPAKNKFIK